MTKFGLLSCFTCLLLGATALAQPNTDVYLLDIKVGLDLFEMNSIENLSNNEGYDNQPSFDGSGHLYYAKNVGNQTDIARYWMAESGTKIIHPSTPGGEYSPQRIPTTSEIAAVRLDTNGIQRLYVYLEDTYPRTPLFSELQVAYFAFNDANTLLGSVLAGDHLDLVIANRATQKIDTILTQVGRSIHKVPKVENTMSYTALNEDKNFDVYQLDMTSRESFFVVQLPIGVQDMVWLDDSKILIGSGASLFLYDLFGNGEWKKVADLSQYHLKDITRLAVNASSTQLALVAEPVVKTPSDIVQAHIEPYNTGNLEDFANAFSPNVVVQNFPKDTTLVGRAQLKASYEKFFANNTELSVAVTKRLTHKNYVIDEEEAIVNGKKRRHATVYETGEDGIQSMTFIQNKRTKKDPTVIVDQQLAAYNARDIDAFMATYSNDIQLYGYPNRPNSQGQAAMKQNYAGFFNNTPDLHCKIINRIVIGNKVIDQEKVTSNGSSFGAIAIYEVENELISKVTFLQ